MRTTIANLRCAWGFALVELLLALAVGLVLAALLLSMLAKNHRKPGRVGCDNHLKQVGLAFRIWSSDSSDQYPMSRSTNGGGSLEVANEVWRTFLTMSNELSTPKILTCPTDKRQPAASWETLANSNISYFICLNAEETTPQVPLSGDRNLTNGTPVTPRVMTITSNALPRWTGAMHRNCGNLALSDGSVQQVTTIQLQQQVKAGLADHFNARTNSTLRLAMPE